MASPSRSASTVFTAALSDDVKQRRALIPKIAKALSTWNNLTAHSRAATTSTDNSSSKHDVSSVEWIEEKLWLSMTRMLGIDIGVDATSSSTLRNESTDMLDCDDLLLASSDSGRNGSLRPPPTEVAAETDATRRGPKPFRHLHHLQSLGCRAGISNKSCDETVSTNMHASAASLTHIDQKGEICRQINAPQNVIRQDELIHCSESTLCYQPNEQPDILEDIIIYAAARPSTVPFRQSSAIQVLNTSTDTNDTNILTPTSDTFEDSLITEMDSSNPSQSLKEVLGDDMLLWSMWKRRPSTCPPGEDDAELLHNMFENDPDMKLFSPIREEDMSFNDIMMLDSYDFSRKSTSSSTSTTPDSYSRGAFEQLEQISSYSYSSPVSSTSRSTQPSIRDTKEQRRKSSGLKKASRSARMTEDDIIFQQTSPSRSIDIKSRRSVRDYSGR